MVKLKVGRIVFDIDENDLILDNGACYQMITKKIRKGCDSKTPKMSQTLFRSMKNTGLIYTNDSLKKAAMETYSGDDSVTFWKFDIERMKKLGY